MARHHLREVDRETQTGICSVCGPTRVRVRSGRGNQCYSQVIASRQRLRISTEPRPRALTKRDYVLKSRYGLTQDEVDAMRSRQGGCAICGADGALVVDHDHDSGAVRGLLCRTCNTGIGHLRDDPELIAAALRYLTQR